VLEDQLVEGDDDEDEDDARYLNLEGDEDGKHIHISPCCPSRLLTPVFRGRLGRRFCVSRDSRERGSSQFHICNLPLTQIF
jgi:hypothetical protein